jgi:AcrR family transcriptional regulator
MTTASDGGVKRKRVAKAPEERRRDLLDASAAVFSRDGLPDAKIEDITALAGVSKGTFYLYFPSKEAAAAEVWRRYIGEYQAIGESILADESVAVGDRLAAVFEALTRFVLSHSALHQALFTAPDSGKVKADANEALIQLVTDAARTGVERGELGGGPPDLGVRTLFHGLCGATNDALAMTDRPSDDALINNAGRLARVLFPGHGSIQR